MMGHGPRCFFPITTQQGIHDCKMFGGFLGQSARFSFLESVDPGGHSLSRPLMQVHCVTGSEDQPSELDFD